MEEIERKFLVAAVPRGLAFESEERIRQGYIALDGGVEVRVRERAGRSTLTVKSSGDLKRLEVELEISPEQFAALWELSDGRRIEKVRRTVRADGALLELDTFEGALAGLVLVEVEFPSLALAERFDPPPWFGREVTDDRAYKNRSLAVNGAPG